MAYCKGEINKKIKVKQTETKIASGHTERQMSEEISRLSLHVRATAIDSNVTVRAPSGDMYVRTKSYVMLKSYVIRRKTNPKIFAALRVVKVPEW